MSGESDHFEDLLNPAGVPAGELRDDPYKHITHRAVTNSAEFQRILKLPRRAPDDVANVPDVTALFRKKGGTMNLRPRQSAALVEAAHMNGLFAPLPVGEGKALIALCLAEALDAKKAVLMVPAALKRQVLRDIDNVYSKHFTLPLDRLEIITYNDLSQASKENLLEDLAPDLIIADEAHQIRNRTAARTKRFLRYMNAHLFCRFCALSGTITARSIRDYAHLLELALRSHCPLPRDYRELKDWAGALDVKPEYPMLPGVLKKFCTGTETVREGFQRRLVETQGVVAGNATDVGSSLIIIKHEPIIPTSVAMLLMQVRKSWSLAGEEFQDILSYHRALRQLACGFYYKWKWPGGVPDDQWLFARAEWHKAVREKLKQSLKGMDSPLLLAQAADRALMARLHGQAAANTMPLAGAAGVAAWNGVGAPPSSKGKQWDCPEWAAWKAVKDRPVPPTETVWVDDFLVREMQKLAMSTYPLPTIIWFDHRAVGEKLGELMKLPVYGEGTDISASTDAIVIASLRVHGTGRNLQFYCNNILASVPSSGSTYEQFLGRTHRLGQTADEVACHWFAHTPEALAAMESVMTDAIYVEQSTGSRQKVLQATHLDALSPAAA